jgi:hypothetical protein
MALPKIEPIELQYLDLWFANIVDTINYDLGQIEVAVPALSMMLTTVDTAPIQYLKDSLTRLVATLNQGFEQIDDRMRKIESRIDSINSNVTQGGK